MQNSKFRVAVLVDSSSGWGRRLIRGIVNYGLRANQWQLLVEERGSTEALHLPPGWRGDGIIARVNSHKLHEELLAAGKPVVNISGIHLKGVNLPCIATNHEASARLALEHFEARGFQHLAYCGLEYRPHELSHCKAFVDAAKAHDLDCQVFHSKLPIRQRTWGSERQELLSWLSSLPKPVGIFAWGTRRGRNILNVCNDSSIPVPEEIAVLAGDDDELLCEACYPPMSGVITPAMRIGFEAAEMLDSLMQGKTPETLNRLLEPEDIDTRMSTDTLAVTDPCLVKAIRFIRDNLRSPLQVADVAAEAQISRRALERRFADVIGHSPAREIHKARLRRARQLLRETALSVADVAASCGYGSPEYMIKIFQKDTGLTPLKYRTRVNAR